jgi:hypothetical protein
VELSNCLIECLATDRPAQCIWWCGAGRQRKSTLDRFVAFFGLFCDLVRRRAFRTPQASVGIAVAALAPQCLRVANNPAATGSLSCASQFWRILVLNISPSYRLARNNTRVHCDFRDSLIPNNPSHRLAMIESFKGYRRKIRVVQCNLLSVNFCRERLMITNFLSPLPLLQLLTVGALVSLPRIGSLLHHLEPFLVLRNQKALESVSVCVCWSVV